MRKGLRRNAPQAHSITPLRYSRHPSYGARVFFNDRGYQAHTIVCWFERDPLNRKLWAFRARRRGADIPKEEWNRHFRRACTILERNGLNPTDATYSDIVELAKSLESGAGRVPATGQPGLGE